MKAENFSLSKAKLISKGGGLDCHYIGEEVDGSEIFKNKYHVEKAMDIHPDLTNKFLELKYALARVYHLTFATQMMSLDEFKANKKQEELGVKMENEVLERIRVSGIEINGQNQNRGVVISGLFEFDTGKYGTIKTHKLHFDTDRYGFEKDLERTIDTIERECYEYIYNRKRAQLSMFSNDDFEDGKTKAAGE